MLGFRNPKVDETYCLKLNGSRESDRTLIHKIKNFKFPNYRQLMITNAQEIPSDDLNIFFTNASSNSLQNLNIDFDGNIQYLVPSFANTLTAVTGTVYLKNLKMNQDSLRLIFEECFTARRVVFNHCEFIGMVRLLTILIK